MQPNKRKKILTILACTAALAIGYFVYQSITYVGTDNAYVQAHTVILSARVSGIIEKVTVEENQRVRAGDPLVMIDDRDYANKLQQAEGDASSLNAKLEEAQRNFKRISSLFRQGAVSAQQYDDSQTAYKETAEKAKSVNAQVEQARLNLSYTKISAPSDGVVAKRSVELGAFVAVGQPLLGFVESRDRWIIANFKETELADIHPGSRALITVDAVPGRNFQGVVESVSPSTGATFALLPPDNATGNFTKVVQRVPVKIRLTGLDNRDIDRLQAGLSAVVSIYKRR